MDIQNAEMNRRIADKTGLQVSTSELPKKLSPLISPVMEVGQPRSLNIIRGSGAVSVATTLYTTPTNEDFYLSYANVSGFRDGDTREFFISAVIDGATRKILSVYGGNFADNGLGVATCNFIIPIKIDRNTSIIVSLDLAGTNKFFGANIGGYTTIY